jgi:hypothetical protein
MYFKREGCSTVFQKRGLLNCILKEKAAQLYFTELIPAVNQKGTVRDDNQKKEFFISAS